MFGYFRAGAQGKVILSEAKNPSLCLSKPGRQILRFAQNDGEGGRLTHLSLKLSRFSRCSGLFGFKKRSVFQIGEEWLNMVHNQEILSAKQLSAVNRRGGGAPSPTCTEPVLFAGKIQEASQYPEDAFLV
jgi:hypothetical protein